MPQVRVVRGRRAEAIHPFSAAVVADGRVIERFGRPVRTSWRSAAKPFQLWSSLEALGDPELPTEALAVGSSSHSAQAEHLAQVSWIFEHFRVDPAALRCGAHAPSHAPSAEALLRAGGAPQQIHNNCSGKHAFMLAACAARGWRGDYRDPDHPYQRAVVAQLTERCGARPDLAVDGCGVPTFFLEIGAFARAWEQVGASLGGADARLGRVADAMLRHPRLISGDDRIDLDLSRGAREVMLNKIGAQALECVALPARGLAIAVKVHSGAEEALPAAVAWTLERVAPGAWERPAGWRREELRNVAGAVVGRYEVRA